CRPESSQHSASVRSINKVASEKDYRAIWPEAGDQDPLKRSDYRKLMIPLFISGCILFTLRVAASAGVVRGTLLNDDDPYIIRGDDGNIYKAEWYWRSTLFSEGDQVILTDNDGEAKMID